MSTYTLQLLPAEPIIVLTFTPEFSIARDMPEVAARVDRIMDESPQPLFYIANTEHLTVYFADMMEVASTIARTPGTHLHHPNMREFLIVTTRKLIGMVARGLQSDVYGNVRVRVFASYEEALEYARQQIAITSF